jgi:hypothetical protein
MQREHGVVGKIGVETVADEQALNHPCGEGQGQERVGGDQPVARRQLLVAVAPELPGGRAGERGQKDVHDAVDGGIGTGDRRNGAQDQEQDGRRPGAARGAGAPTELARGAPAQAEAGKQQPVGHDHRKRFGQLRGKHEEHQRHRQEQVAGEPGVPIGLIGIAPPGEMERERHQGEHDGVGGEKRKTVQPHRALLKSCVCLRACRS